MSKCLHAVAGALLVGLSFVAPARGAGSDSLLAWLNSGAPADFLLIDLRESYEVAAYGVIGSDSCIPYNLPWNSGVCSTLVRNSVPDTCLIVVYCASGGRAGSAATWLSANGYDRVVTAGGYNNWSGPTMPSDWVKADSLLPAPSMHAAPTAVRSPAAVRLRSGDELKPAIVDLRGRRIGRDQGDHRLMVIQSGRCREENGPANGRTTHVR